MKIYAFVVESRFYSLRYTLCNILQGRLMCPEPIYYRILMDSFKLKEYLVIERLGKGDGNR